MTLMTLVQALVLLPVVSAAQCVDDGECRPSGAQCCSGRQRTEATCGYIGPGTIDCRPVCENVTALVLQKLGNGSDCAAIRKQEGIDAGAGRGICDILYQGEEPCVGLLPQLLSKTCAMAEANRSLSPLQLCIESDACDPVGLACSAAASRTNSAWVPERIAANAATARIRRQRATTATSERAGCVGRSRASTSVLTTSARRARAVWA